MFDPYKAVMDLENKDLGNVPLDDLIAWVKLFCVKSDKVYKGKTSYSYKHYAESFFGSYVTNDGMKLAFVKAGYRTPNSHQDNWYFNVSTKSPAVVLEQNDFRDIHNLILKEGK